MKIETNAGVNIPQEWKQFLQSLDLSRAATTVYVLGGVDSGKSTLCRYLVESLSGRYSTALIDCDPGQSFLGPPTTLGMMLYHHAEPMMEKPLLRFIGATTPTGHLLPALTAIKRLSEKARDFNADVVVLDSSGFALGPVASEFQFHVIDLIRPDHLIALQQNRELEPLLAHFNRHPRMCIHRFGVSSHVIPKTPPQRRFYREKKFQEYFSAARLWRMAYRPLGLRGRIPNFTEPATYKNRLIALCDRDQFVLTLGILHHIEIDSGKIQFYAPPFDHRQIAGLHFGSIYVSRSGQQLLIPSRHVRPPSSRTSAPDTPERE